MDAKGILQQWTAAVNDLLSHAHGHQRKALAAMSLAMALSRGCDSGRLCASIPLNAKPSSIRRRLERLLANRRVHPARLAMELGHSIFSCWSDRPLLLILDETPGPQDLRCMKLSIGYRKRAVPLVWACYPMDRPPAPMPRLIWRLLHRAARCLPQGAHVTLLADRGLAWPSLLDSCVQLGWHYVLRLQRYTRICQAGQQQPLGGLLDHRGGRWFAQHVKIFKKAGWREVNVVVNWDQRCKAPWLLASDLPASYARCRSYAKRMWCEQLHRDEKSQGFGWQKSQVRDPKHVDRLLLLMALATLLALSLGMWLLKRGLRRMIEATRSRKLSLFQLGIRWLRIASIQDRAWPLIFSLPPP